MKNQTPITTIAKGSYGGSPEAGNHIINNKKQWEKLMGFALPPEINFRKQTVIAAFMGQKRTGGFAIEVTDALTFENEFVAVGIKKTGPKPGYMVTMALTQPFHVVAIPKAVGLPVRTMDVSEFELLTQKPELNTYVIMLETKDDPSTDGNREAAALESAEAIAKFQKTLAEFTEENQLTAKVKVFQTLDLLGGLIIQTTADIAERIRSLDGVGCVAEDGEVGIID